MDNSTELLKLNKELKKRQLQLALPVAKRYFIIMLVVVLLNFLVDTLASSLNEIYLSDAIFAINNIFPRDIKSDAYKEGFNQFNILKPLISFGFVPLIPLYKSLSDKYGRKTFLWLNTLITAAGMFIMLNATNLIVYAIGYAIMNFFFNGDVHQLYLMEESPKEYRTTIVSTVRMFGNFGASILGVLGLIFKTEETIVNGWRNVFFVCFLIAIPVVIISILTIKETRTFLEERISYLENRINELGGMVEVKKETKKTNKEESQKGGLINAIKYMFNHKQTKIIFFTAILVAGGMIFQTVYSTINESGSLSAQDVNLVAVVFPFAAGLFSFLNGIISDKVGRKVSFTLMTVLSIVGFVTWVLTIDLGISGIVVGICYGILKGGYWGARELLIYNIAAESTPTNIRASVMSLLGFISTMGYFILNYLAIAVMNITNEFVASYIGVYSLLMIAALILFLFGIKETKGTDLDAVTGEEFD